MGRTSATTSYAVAQRLRKNGEDRFSARVLSNGFFYAGIYDGHNGSGAAELCAQYMPELLALEYRKAQPTVSAMRKAFVALHELVNDASGTTATVLLTHGRYLACAHVGDSRAVLCHKRCAVTVTEDHHIAWEPERARVAALERALHTNVIFGNRVDGLMLTRSIGDHSLSPAIVAHPIVHELLVTQHDEYIIVATDGFWDVCTGAEAVDLVLAQGTDNEHELAEALVDHAMLAYKSRGARPDDVTCAVVHLQKRRASAPQKWSFESVMREDSLK